MSENKAQWRKIEEKSAGEKRLLLTFFLYKIFGAWCLYLIAFFVSFFTFLLNKDIRFYSKKYFSALFEYTGNKRFYPSLFNSFLHILNFGFSLADKIKFLSGAKAQKITFEDKNFEEIFFKNIENKKGMFLIFNHVGNIEVFRSILSDKKRPSPLFISIILTLEHCKKFRNLIQKIEVNSSKIKFYPIEEMGATSAIELEEDIKRGALVFGAGDRIAGDMAGRNQPVLFLGKKVFFPKGIFRLSKMLDVETYFISCTKTKKGYKIYSDKVTDFNNAIDDFAQFCEKLTLMFPYQFFQFYDIFN